MEVRTPYNYDSDEVSKNTALICPEETLTQQNMKDESDINLMIKRFGVQPLNELNWEEYDATAIPTDFHKLNNMIIDAKEAYADLPSDIRAATDNDPVKFLAMLDQEKAAIKKQHKADKQAEAESPGRKSPSDLSEADKPVE